MRHKGTTATKRLPADLIDNRMLMALLEQCRRECLHLHHKTVIHSPAYEATSRMTEAIDGLAEALTGRRDYFHLPAHAANTSYKG